MLVNPPFKSSIAATRFGNPASNKASFALSLCVGLELVFVECSSIGGKFNIKPLDCPIKNTFIKTITSYGPPRIPY